MTDKNQEICECGHVKNSHERIVGYNMCAVKNCPCKKFKPQSPEIKEKLIEHTQESKDTQNPQTKLQIGIPRNKSEKEVWEKVKDKTAGISLSDKIDKYIIPSDPLLKLDITKDVRSAVQKIFERIGSSKRITTKRVKEIIKSEFGEELTK